MKIPPPFHSIGEIRRSMKFGSREIGYAAAFGGLAFAFRALGINIPVGPVYFVGPAEIATWLGGLFAGLIGGVIVGILRAIPSAGFCIPWYMASNAGWWVVWKIFRRPWYYIFYWVNVYLIYAPIWGHWYAWYGYMPFWAAYWVATMDGWIYFIPIILIIESARRFSPEMRALLD